jgi:hypothetical protein
MFALKLFNKEKKKKEKRFDDDLKKKKSYLGCAMSNSIL